MSSLFDDLPELAGEALGTAIGFALGFAARDALGPVATGIKQDAYTALPNLALSPKDAASVVAQAIESNGWGSGEAANSGVNGERFAALAQSLLVAPAPGTLIQLLRRGAIGDGDYAHAMRKGQYETTWDGPVKSLTVEPLAPAEIAKAIHRGIMQADGLLIAVPPSTPGNVPAVPPSSLDPVNEASWSGISAERLRVLVGNAGLPLGLHEMLSLLNRGYMTASDVQRGIAESNLRNEYQDVALQLARMLLTPHEYGELVIRGWIDPDVGAAGAAQHGMTGSDFALLTESIGRPIPLHQVTTGEARKGTYNGDSGSIPEAYLRSLREGNLRPEWYSLAYANRYTIPSYFVLAAVLRAGGITQEQFADYGKQLGWPPDLAEKAAKAEASSGTTTAKELTAAQWLTEYEGDFITRPELITHLSSLGYNATAAEAYAEYGDAKRTAASRNARLNRIHSRYVAYKLTDAQGLADLEALALPKDAQDRIWADWQAEREINETLLTQAQIVKAYKQSVFTRDQTTAALVERGMSAADAATLLDEQ